MKSEWISVKDRMPEQFVTVIGLMKEGVMPFPMVRECYLIEDGFWFSAINEFVEVTHWMPMPEPPEEES